jgi:hypothetical protein
MHDDPTTTGQLDRRISDTRDATHPCARKLARAVERHRAEIVARSRDLMSLAGRLPRFGAIICALTISGCAGNAPQPESRSEPIRSGAAAPASTPHQGSNSQMCRIDRALLVPARAPDCGFGRSDLKTLDPDEWTHLKLEFEKKCYQRAEKLIRERLRQLQVASRCGIEQASR